MMSSASRLIQRASLQFITSIIAVLHVVLACCSVHTGKNRDREWNKSFSSSIKKMELVLNMNQQSYSLVTSISGHTSWLLMQWKLHAPYSPFECGKAAKQINCLLRSSLCLFCTESSRLPSLSLCFCLVLTVHQPHRFFLCFLQSFHQNMFNLMYTHTLSVSVFLSSWIHCCRFYILHLSSGDFLSGFDLLVGRVVLTW